MSSRTFRRVSLRRVLAGSLVTAFLTLGSPVSVKAADLFESADAPSLWALAWQWLTEQISQEEEPAASADAEAPAQRDGSDAGWILDPNG